VIPLDRWREVPPHGVEMFGPRKSRYCVIVFALDEGARFAAQIEAMRPLAADIDIIAADGGSTDGSVDRRRMEPNGVRAVLVNRGPRGLGAQMRMAFDFVLAEGYEGVVCVDGNGKDDTSAVPRFVAALDHGFDHVQGSRFIAGGKGINTPLDRLIAVRLIHAPAIRLASGYHYTDTTNGFRAYSRRLLTDPRVAVLRDCFVGYGLHYYLAIRAARLGFRLTEVAVIRRYPVAGTPTKIHGLRGRARVVQALVAACLGRYDPIAAP
jgi:dolichol-phosphate mannosyltransferase